MNQARIIQDYATLRRAIRPLNSRLMEMLSKDEVSTAARTLGKLRNNCIELETDDELSVIIDYAIYNLSRNGRNVIGRMLDDDPPAEGSIDLRLLRSMQSSHYTIFEVEERIPGFGVRGFDTMTDEPIMIVDMGFSTTAEPEQMLATRIFSPAEGWWMTTGAALPLHNDALEQVWREFRDHQNRFERKPTDIEWATMVTRSCLASGASQYIGYMDIRKGRSTKKPALTVSTPKKIGRNDPCPCGSGKKYKVCCAIMNDRDVTTSSV